MTALTLLAIASGWLNTTIINDEPSSTVQFSNSIRCQCFEHIYSNDQFIQCNNGTNTILVTLTSPSNLLTSQKLPNMKMSFEVDGTTTFYASELEKGNLFIQKHSTNLDLNETFLCSNMKRIFSRIRQQFERIISGPIPTPISGMTRHDVAEMATFTKLRNISSHKLASCSLNVTDQTMSSVGSKAGILYTYLCRGYALGNIRKTNILGISLEMFENEKNCTKMNQCESRCFSMESHNEPITKENNTPNWNKTLMVIAEYLPIIVILWRIWGPERRDQDQRILLPNLLTAPEWRFPKEGRSGDFGLEIASSGERILPNSSWGPPFVVT